MTPAQALAAQRIRPQLPPGWAGHAADPRYAPPQKPVQGGGAVAAPKALPNPPQTSSAIHRPWEGYENCEKVLAMWQQSEAGKRAAERAAKDSADREFLRKFLEGK